MIKLLFIVNKSRNKEKDLKINGRFPTNFLDFQSTNYYRYQPLDRFPNILNLQQFSFDQNEYDSMNIECLPKLSKKSLFDVQNKISQIENNQFHQQNREMGSLNTTDYSSLDYNQYIMSIEQINNFASKKHIFNLSRKINVTPNIKPRYSNLPATTVKSTRNGHITNFNVPRTADPKHTYNTKIIL